MIDFTLGLQNLENAQCKSSTEKLKSYTGNMILIVSNEPLTLRLCYSDTEEELVPMGMCKATGSIC